METYRFSSKLNESDREYLIQTANEASSGSVRTTVYVNGVPAESLDRPHPSEINAEEILSFVELTHGEKKKEIETLLQVYREVIQRRDLVMMYHLGTAFFYKGFYLEAKELFQEVVELNPSHHQAHNFLGMTELALGNHKQATAAASRAVDERPGYADYRNNLAEALLAGSVPDRAIVELEQALQINMYYADAYFNLGLAYILQALKKQEPENLVATVKKTSECFHRASLIYANFKGQAFEAGMQALRSHNLDEALNIFKRIREEKKDAHRQEFAAFYMKFVIHPDWVSEKAVRDRIKFLRAELAKNPTYVDMYGELAQCFFEQSRLAWREGIKQLQTTFEINPSLVKVSSILAEADDVYAGMAKALKNFEQKR